MIELAKHIEKLLLDNDCVIVPGLGGFVAHYTPSVHIEEENLFLPPTRVIGFNPQVRMNDGLLAQSYMEVYNTSFPDATHMVNKQVDRLMQCLHEEGKADLPNVGKLHYSIHGIYEFTPYDEKITTPYLYGLASFEMKALKDICTAPQEKAAPDYMVPDRHTGRKMRFKIHIKPSYWLNAAAMVAIIMLFFLLSAPIENTEVIKGNYASLFPENVFREASRQSLAFVPVSTRPESQPVKQKLTDGTRESQEKPQDIKNQVVAREVKVKEQTEAQPLTSVKEDSPRQTETAGPAPAAQKRYHIIVASVSTEDDANEMVRQLIKKGFKGATAIVGDGKKRVSIESCATYAEAKQTLNEVCKNGMYQGAWILKH